MLNGNLQPLAVPDWIEFPNGVGMEIIHTKNKREDKAYSDRIQFIIDTKRRCDRQHSSERAVRKTPCQDSRPFVSGCFSQAVLRSWAAVLYAAVKI